MYQIILTGHAVLRWFVLVFVIIACIKALMGWIGKKPWTKGDSRIGLFMTIAADTQLLLGLVLYFALSPVVRTAFSNMGAAMKDKTLRFWAVEHTMTMLLAIVFIHVCRIAVRKAKNDRSRQRRAFAWSGLALLALLAGNPWPFLAVGRRLFPF